MNEIPPIRIQRRRTKGFNLQAQSPDGRPVKSVCRPGKWGNRFQVVKHVQEFLVIDPNDYCWGKYKSREFASKKAVELYSEWVKWTVVSLNISELRGKHLACFCPL